MASSATSRSPSSRIRVARLRPRIHAIKRVEQFAYLLGGTPGHDDDLSKPPTPNQFGKRRIDAKCPGRDLNSGQQNASSVDSKSPIHSSVAGHSLHFGLSAPPTASQSSVGVRHKS